MSQANRLLSLLKDGQPHSNFEIIDEVCSIRYSARIHDLRQQGYVINKWHDKEVDAKWWYQLVLEPATVKEPLTFEDMFQTQMMLDSMEEATQ